MAKEKKSLVIFLISCLIVLGLAISFTPKTCYFASVEKEVVTTRKDFSTALSKKQSIIYVGNIDFEETPISIDLTYSVQITGRNGKVVFSNAHFNIVGGSTIDNIISITFKNIKFDGCYNTLDKVLESGKTFKENFETDRTNPIFKAIVPTGVFDLKIDNCEFYNYVSKSGAIIYRFNGEPNPIYSNINISNTKVYNNICEESPIYIVDKSLNLKILDSEFYNNTTQFCSGVSIFGAKSELDNISICNNKFNNFASEFDKYGGGLFIASSDDVLVKNSDISNNSAYNGGGIQITNSNATFYNCKILNNKVFSTGTSKAGILYCDGGYGGGVFIISSEGQIVKFENCNISANSSVRGGAIAIMPAYKNAKGGRIELTFCNIGLNSQEDGEAVKYYGYSEQNKGELLVRGCIIIDETSLQLAEENYNFISSKDEALLDNVINEDIIDNIKTNGLAIVLGSKADKIVPKDVMKNWDLYSSNIAVRKIGVNEIEFNQNNNLMIILLSISIPFLSIIIIIALFIKNRNNKDNKKDIIISDENEQKENISKPASNILENEDVDKIISNISKDISFSKKETEVLKLALIGKSRKEMASECYVTEHTIKKHLSNIYAKMEVGTRKELLEKSKQYLE